MDDAKRLQDLISSNALMAAILGEPDTNLSNDNNTANVVDTNTNTTDTNTNTKDPSPTTTTTGTEVTEIINSIASSHDIDGLVDGIASNLQYFVQNLASSSLPMLVNVQGPAIEGAMGVGGIRRSRSVDVDSNTTTTTATTTTRNLSGISTNTNISASASRDNIQCVNDTGTSISSTIVSDNTAASKDASASSTTTNNTKKPQQIALPLQLLTLVCRIARIKDLLYNENISSSLSNNNNTNTNNNHNETPTSFIQHFLPMISGTSHSNDQQYYMDYHTSSPSSSRDSSPNSSHRKRNRSSYAVNTNNAKQILQSMLNKNTNPKSNSNKIMIIPTLLQYLHLLPFESRKNVSSIFNYLLVINSDYNVRMEFVFYVHKYFICIMDYIVSGHFATEEDGTANIVASSSVGAGGSGSNKTGNDHESKSGEENVKTTNKKLEKDLNNTINIKTNSSSSHPTHPTTTATPMKTPDIALHFGSMLRSIIRHPILYAKLVNDEANVQKYILPFLDSLVNQANFEVASDALETLRFMLHPIDMDIVLPFDTDGDHGGDGGPLSSSPTNDSFTMNHATSVTESSTLNNDNDDDIAILSTLKDGTEVEAFMERLSSKFLERDYESIFTQRFNPKLLSSDHANYITRRLSLQLLSSILLSRSNYNIMIRYVSSKDNLRTIMMLLRDTSAHITLEAFNVFKIFVANPNKPKEVMRILADNKVKLIKYLTGLHKDKEDIDEQFRDEKILVISTLEQLN